MQTRQLSHLVRAMGRPLCIERQTLDALVRVFRQKLGGMEFGGERLHAELGIASPRTRGKRQPGAVAVIPIVGVIANRVQSLGTSVQEIRAMLEAALANQDVGSIVLDIESPGGEVTGTPELAERIYNARDEKPIVAVANGFMASAAYWLGSQAAEVVVTPSGQVGSIGVFMLHEDWTEHLEKEGIRLTAISAGKFKVEGAPWEELTKEATAFYQQQVEEVYGWFVSAVARARGATPSTRAS